MNIERVACLAALLAMPGCAPASTIPAAAASETAPAVHPLSGMPLITVTVDTTKGPHAFTAEYAGEPTERTRGLMFRTELGANEAMIFDFSTTDATATPRRFWMHNTYIPLDIIFIRTDGVIDTVAANAVPYSDAGVPSRGPTMYVLEIPGGRAAELGIREGGKVSFSRP